jgi:hypothetical protein
MRWFVEVSRVGENSSDEKYCVEAKQWQAALQEARKLRGDSGPLSKFSIELLDDGYRAVDPKQKLRYVVAKAPQDAQLSSMPPESAFRAEAPHRNGQQASGPSASSAPMASSVVPPSVAVLAPAAQSAVSAAPVVAAAPAPTAVLAPALTAAPAPAVAAVPTVAPVPEPTTAAAVPALAAAAPAEIGGAPAPAAAPEPTPLVAVPPMVAPRAGVVADLAVPIAAVPVATEAPVPGLLGHAEPFAGVPSSALSPNAPASAVHVSAASQAAKSPSAFPPRPGSVRPPSVRPAAGIAVPVDAIPRAPAVPQGLGPPVPQQHTQPSAAIDLPPPASVLRKRQEEPTPESPITYREIAYVVDPGVTRGSVEALLWASFRDISRELAEREGQKFVQLAVFDHRFERRPERAPLGTLAWKDWRGNPVLSFPFFDGTPHVRPSGAPPSIVPVPVVSVTNTAPPITDPAPAVAPAAMPPRPEPAPPQHAAPLVIAAPAADSAPPPAPAVIAPAFGVVEAALPAGAGPAGVDAKSDPQGAAIPLTREKLPSHPSAARGSRPRLAAVRRRAGEDLIGELFETMHDLHFMSGVADGAEFVLAAVDSVVPCEGVLVHVFDINARQFVVVRAKGPGTMQAVLHRTPDSEPFIDAVMRRPGSVAIHDVQKDTRVLGPRWDALGVQPTRALCGPVRQGGRYLGLLEVVNPLGDAPFHQTEQNAIDYVCQQFAEFLANRPIVLDADVILRR